MPAKRQKVVKSDDFPGESVRGGFGGKTLENGRKVEAVIPQVKESDSRIPSDSNTRDPNVGAQPGIRSDSLSDSLTWVEDGCWCTSSFEKNCEETCFRAIKIDNKTTQVECARS
jgi:hypothetical protein